jgi:porphobilinogen synthase
MRRLRRTPGIRRMLGETHLSAADLVQPLFVRHGGGPSDEIASMPGQHHHGIDGLVE